MQTQASVLDIGGGALSVKGAPVKAGGDDGQFADTLRDQLQGANSPEPRARTEAPRAKAKSDAQQSDDASAQQQEAGDADGQAQQTTAAAQGEQCVNRDKGSLVVEEQPPLALALLQPQQLPPQPLHPLHLALTLQQQGEAVAGEGSDEITPVAAPFALTTQPPVVDGESVPGALGDEPLLPSKGAAQLTNNLSDKDSLVAESGVTEEGAAADASLLTNATDIKAGQGKEAGSFKELLAALPVAGESRPEPLQGVVQGASPLGAASPAAPPVNSSALPPTLSVANPVQQPQWRSEVGERLLWMVKQEVQEAQLQLNPRHLGPIEVRIAMHNDQATVQFIAHHGATREALEAALPRLRDMFQEAGLQMNNSSVFSQEQFQQHQQQAAAGGREGRGSQPGRGAEGVENSAPLPLVESAVPLRGIDYYA